MTARGEETWRELADPNSPTLSGRARVLRLAVPEDVELKKGVLKFGWSSPRQMQVPAALLDRFLGLRSDEQFLHFARRYGPLMIPSGPESSPRLYSVGLKETLASWREYQAVLARVLSLAANLLSGADITDPPWSGVLGGFGIQPIYLMGDLTRRNGEKVSWSERTRTQRRQLAAGVVVQCGARIAELFLLRPAFTFAATSARFGFYFASGAGASLGGSLAVQFIHAVSAGGFAICSGCRQPFVPKRQPSQGRRCYCAAKACRVNAALRDAQRDWRQRQSVSKVKRKRQQGRPERA